jgi:hypothetical protein
MFKRVVSLLMLPILLLTQCASAAHCHCRHVSGDGTPHIHLANLPFTGSTRQVDIHNEHQGCTHNHGDDDDGDENERSPAAPDEDSQDHDANGVLYVPASLASGWITGRIFSTQQDAADLPFLAFCDSLLIQAPSLVKSHHSPPFLAVSDCPTFLRKQTLLI